MRESIPFAVATDQALQLVLGAKISAGTESERGGDEHEKRGVNRHEEGERGHAVSSDEVRGEVL
jgi:hypothetical protein